MINSILRRLFCGRNGTRYKGAEGDSITWSPSWTPTIISTRSCVYEDNCAWPSPFHGDAHSCNETKMESTEESKIPTSEHVDAEVRPLKHADHHPGHHDPHHVVHGLVEPTRLFGQGRPFSFSYFPPVLADLVIEGDGHVTKKYLLPRPTNDPRDPLVCEIFPNAIMTHPF